MLANLAAARFGEINTNGVVDYRGHRANLDVGRFDGGVTSTINVGLQNLGAARFHEINTEGTLDYHGRHGADLDVGRFDGGVTSVVDIGSLQNLWFGHCSGAACNQERHLQNLGAARFGQINTDGVV